MRERCRAKVGKAMLPSTDTPSTSVLPPVRLGNSRNVTVSAATASVFVNRNLQRPLQAVEGVGEPHANLVGKLRGRGRAGRGWAGGREHEGGSREQRPRSPAWG